MGNMLIIAGVILVLAGLAFKVGWLDWFGHLPGDIRIEAENVHIFFPLVSMLIVSVFLSAILYFIKR